MSSFADVNLKRTCPLACRLFPESYLVGELEETERRIFERHVRVCSDCAEATIFGSFILRIIAELRVNVAILERVDLRLIRRGRECPKARKLMPERYLMRGLTDLDRKNYEDHFVTCEECIEIIVAAAPAN